MGHGEGQRGIGATGREMMVAFFMLPTVGSRYVQYLPSYLGGEALKVPP